MLSSSMFGRIQPWDDQAKIALGFLATGIAVLTVGRAIAQHYQRQGMLAHFVAVLLPTQRDRARERMMGRILEGLARVSPKGQQAAWKTMHRAWDGIDDDERSLMAWATVTAMAEMAPAQREALIQSQAEALAQLDERIRSRATTELTRAITGLEPERREEVVKQFAPVIA